MPRSTFGKLPNCNLKKIILLASSFPILSFPFMASSESSPSIRHDSLTKITGSRIAQAHQNSSQSIIFTRKEIEQSGEDSAADFLRNMVFNSTGSFRPQSGSSLQGIAALDLYGLGSGKTLILVDGRRMAKSSFSGNIQDLTTIALRSIERIEILPSSSSATYGADAVAGVVNIITRTNIDGVELSIGAAAASLPKDGGERTNGSLLFGKKLDNMKYSGGLAWNEREIVYNRDETFNTQGASVYGNSYTTLSGGFDNFDWMTIPDGSTSGACDFPDTAFYTVANRCAYDFTLVSADEASSKNQSFWLNGSVALSDKVEVWASTSYAKSSSFGRYAPVPDSSYFFSAPLTINSPNNPSNPSGFYFDATRFAAGAEVVNWWHRFDAVGPRDGFFESKLTDIRLGMSGSSSKLDWDIGVRYSKNQTTDIGKNYVLRDEAMQAIESGAYRLINPFANDEAVLNSIRTDITRRGEDEQTELWANGSVNLFKISERQVIASFGFEYRNESMEDIKDPILESGRVGGATANSNRVTIQYFNNISKSGKRDVTAYYFELFVPLAETFDVSVQGRNDNYENLNSQFSSKISLDWRLFNGFNWNFNYSEDFSVARLDLLSVEPRTFDSTIPLNRLTGFFPPLPDEQIPTTVTNEFLESETSNTYATGFNFNFGESNKISLNYVDTSIENRAQFFDPNRLVVLTNLDVDPLDQIGLGLITNAQGRYTSVLVGYGNMGTIDVEALNLTAQMDYSSESLSFNHIFRANQIRSYKIDGTETTKVSNQHPKIRASLKNALAYSNFEFVWNINMIGRTAGNDPSGSWTTHDLQFNYLTKWGTFTLGALNLNEKAPPIDSGNNGNRPYDFDLYDADGRVTYLKYALKF